jgi:hypothetical protein
MAIESFNEAQYYISFIINGALLPAIVIILMFLAVRGGLAAIKRESISPPVIVRTTIKNILISFALYHIIWQIYSFFFAIPLLGCCAAEPSLYDGIINFIAGLVFYFLISIVAIGIAHIFLAIHDRGFLKIALQLIFVIPALIIFIKTTLIAKK